MANVYAPSKPVYDETLGKSSPYDVHINESLATELFNLNGVSRVLTSKLKIFVNRRGKKGFRAVYNHGRGYFGPATENPDKILTLYTEWAWERYQKYIDTARAIADGNENPKDQFNDVLYTRRLANYLKSVPRERGLKFADRLLKRATQRELAAAFLHESKHVIDDSHYELWREPMHEEMLAFGVPLILYCLGLGQLTERIELSNEIFFPLLVGGFFGVPYLTGEILNKLNITLGGVERRADRFAKRLKNDPKWRSIVTVDYE